MKINWKEDGFAYNLFKAIFSFALLICWIIVFFTTDYTDTWFYIASILITVNLYYVMKHTFEAYRHKSFKVKKALDYSFKYYTLKDDDVVIIDGVIKSCSYDFSNKYIIIPEKLNGQAVTRISDVFYCKGILEIILPSTLKTIGINAFCENQLTSVEIPKGVTSIGGYAFFDNELTEITIPEKATLIEEHAFSSNELTSVEIPEGVTSIGKSAFTFNKLTRVLIPKSVTLIRSGAFSYNNDLSSIILPIAIKEGHTFKEWNTDDDVYDGNTAISDFDFDYEAVFEGTNK